MALFYIFDRKPDKSHEDENDYFMAAIIGSIILSLIAWCAIISFEEPILRFFGADSIWFAMPITELIVSGYAAYMTAKYTKAGA